MFQEIRVAIVEDDPYARDLMAILLWRDWRTRVVAEVNYPKDVFPLIEVEKPDLILLDADDQEKVSEMKEVLHNLPESTADLKVLCVATRPDRTTIDRCLKPPFFGYLIRAEIAYALTWAVSLACHGEWVTTPAVLDQVDPSPVMPVVLKDLPGYPGLTPQEAETARLGILFNLPRRSLAHEKVKTPDTIYEYISKAYDKLGLIDLFAEAEQVQIEDAFADRPVLLEYFYPDLKFIWETARACKKGKRFGEKETFAFHLLSIPEIIYS